MRIDDIAALAGKPVAVDIELTEAFVGYGARPTVKATVSEAPLRVTVGYRSKEKPGARVRLEERFRVGDGRESFRELPVGYEFEVESRSVLGAWDAWRDGKHPKDEERMAARELRYRQQDAIRDAFGRLGMPQGHTFGLDDRGYELKGDQVTVDRVMLAPWLARMVAMYDELSALKDPEAAAGGIPFMPQVSPVVALPVAPVSSTDEIF